jgi:Na+-transporting NADH:ubiquinone oxidoreductase subunit D
MNQEKRESLFSKKYLKLLKKPLNLNNPISVQVLGICSALAVTVQMKPAIVMALSVTVVTGFSCLIISSIRNTIAPNIRIIVQLMVVAALVIIVDQILKAFVYDVSKKLSVYVGLIITNCIILGRVEAFAMGNKPWASFIDGIGNGFGYGLVLIIVSFFRELLGSGKILGHQVIPKALYNAGYINNGLMILPPMALIIIGVIIWIQRSKNPELIDKG